ncbi:replication endonuclease [Herbaspirillum robiniae]|uniref:Replication endonuclease n=1 Tax=Herbaspirillum robiniae TaxID=2014887 RepID=A0ABX2M378_9BURK|nr:replication endonuclease [Herbaspirillum robiniae]NUU02701.1 replication endonuclease [Herbaspirillum robiniae]
MQPGTVDAKTRRQHEAFVDSPQFAGELARIPLKWRGRVVSQALELMSVWHWRKIFEPVAVKFVRDFAEQYVPAGIDLSQDDADICATAEKAAENVKKMLWTAISDTHARDIIDQECSDYGVLAPEVDDDDLRAVIARVVDPRWWRRQLRKVVGRAFEGGNIRLGYVHYHGEPFASNDAVLSRLAQNRRNAAALEATIVHNEAGQEFSIAELAEKTTANKSIRRGELMLRINGFEAIARECNDAGLFLTWTCPSRFHATLHNGKANPNYDGSDPRAANKYLGKMTALARSALARRGIGLYGFRIAEPHHDGCPHWHMLFFVRALPGYSTPHVKDVAGRAVRIMKRYAWRVDRGEPGAFKRRLDVKRIDWSMGSAAGYIAKYVAKNIDGVADHKTKEGYVVTTDTAGDYELTPSARVEAWAARWGIRQFQQWGGAPVSIWRELRRVPEDMVQEAPPAMAAAWNAVQKIKGEKRACWADYLRAQGGALVKRDDLMITLAKDSKAVVGRYEERERITPYGVYCRQMVGVVFKSVRHVWTPVQGNDARASAGLGFPWTRVNNCTEAAAPGFAAEVSFAPAAAPAPIKFAADDSAQIHHAWLALGACPWPRPVVKGAPIGPAPVPAMTADEQRRAVASWDAIKACPWPRMAPVMDLTPRRGTPRQVADWRAGRLDATELPIDTKPKKGNTP